MDIVFLDFDGTINTFSAGDNFSQAACANLNLLLKQVPEAKIVVSSSWRMWGLPKMKEILAKNGIDKEKVVDITGDERGIRGYQIQCWLDRNSKVNHIVILDDESDMGDLMKYLVKTNSFIGLTEADVKQAVEVLKTPMKGKND